MLETARIAVAASVPQECSSIGRAPVSKTGGRRFEPCHSCQLNQAVSSTLHRTIQERGLESDPNGSRLQKARRECADDVCHRRVSGLLAFPFGVVPQGTPRPRRTPLAAVTATIGYGAGEDLKPTTRVPSSISSRATPWSPSGLPGAFSIRFIGLAQSRPWCSVKEAIRIELTANFSDFSRARALASSSVDAMRREVPRPHNMKIPGTKGPILVLGRCSLMRGGIARLRLLKGLDGRVLIYFSNFTEILWIASCTRYRWISAAPSRTL